MYVVTRAKDCFLAYHQVTVSVPVLLLVWISFIMLCVQFILQTITAIHELCHCFNKTRNKVQKSYNLILLFVIINKIVF